MGMESTNMRLLLVIVGVCLRITNAEICNQRTGIPCGSTVSLAPGSSYQIASAKCSNGLYPNNQKCYWYFDVSDCVPSLSCDSLDIVGNPRRRCRGDRLIVETENDNPKYLRGLGTTGVKFTPRRSTYYFDLIFDTNKRKAASGFSCTVSCEAPKKRPITDFQCHCGSPNRIEKIVGGVET